MTEWLLPKPPHGSPCNNCGGCCMQGRCPLGQHLFGEGGRCPALEPELPKFVCGLVTNPGKHAPLVVLRHGETAASEAAAYLISAGVGCDAALEGEKQNRVWLAATKAKIAQMDFGKAEQASRIWLDNAPSSKG